ncbi:hypothetical protein [Mesorhizobium australicum]|uniref:hypothetical protein n=1 Tax=Mesorhizobium australicum TaxID=536018 RepID=UPI0012F6C513|nr:hypothetical protein [Mesorhizobium australicum]
MDLDCVVVGVAQESRARLTEKEISKAKAVASKTWSLLKAGTTTANPVRSFAVCLLVSHGYRAVKNGRAPLQLGGSLGLGGEPLQQLSKRRRIANNRSASLGTFFRRADCCA